MSEQTKGQDKSPRDQMITWEKSEGKDLSEGDEDEIDEPFPHADKDVWKESQQTSQDYTHVLKFDAGVSWED